MKKCQAPDHPYCTHWVAECDDACPAGHQQQQSDRRLALLNASASGLTLALSQTHPLPPLTAPVNLHLHFSGYDPRAAGGRQTIKVEFCGGLPPDISSLDMQLHSELLPTGASRLRLLRTVSGQWQPLLLSFSSRNKEHGQYPLEVTLKHEQEGKVKRKWICTSVVFIPRANTSLTEIHSVFLAAQKNVRIVAEDGAIATLSGLGQSAGYAQGNMNIEINAKDAAIAKLEMRPPTGKYDIALGTIAWDEELIEVAAEPVSSTPPARKPLQNLRQNATPATAPTLAAKWASLIADQSQPDSILRLFALDEWVIGRREERLPQADILLSHRHGVATENTRLSNRISARHAIIRRNATGAEIIDVSRYGILLNGVALEKDKAYPLQTGMHIEFCASVRGIVTLQVVAVQPHVIILADDNTKLDTRPGFIANTNTNINAGKELLYLLKPETRPMSTSANSSLETMPTLFHFQGGFWHRDAMTLQETQINAHTDLRAISQLPSASRYCCSPYADIKEYGIWRNEHIKI